MPTTTQTLPTPEMLDRVRESVHSHGRDFAMQGLRAALEGYALGFELTAEERSALASAAKATAPGWADELRMAIDRAQKTLVRAPEVPGSTGYSFVTPEQARDFVASFHPDDQAKAFNAVAYADWQNALQLFLVRRHEGHWTKGLIAENNAFRARIGELENDIDSQRIWLNDRDKKISALRSECTTHECVADKLREQLAETQKPRVFTDDELRRICDAALEGDETEEGDLTPLRAAVESLNLCGTDPTANILPLMRSADASIAKKDARIADLETLLKVADEQATQFVAERNAARDTIHLMADAMGYVNRGDQGEIEQISDELLVEKAREMRAEVGGLEAELQTLKALDITLPVPDTFLASWDDALWSALDEGEASFRKEVRALVATVEHIVRRGVVAVGAQEPTHWLQHSSLTGCGLARGDYSASSQFEHVTCLDCFRAVIKSEGDKVLRFLGCDAVLPLTSLDRSRIENARKLCKGNSLGEDALRDLIAMLDARFSRPVPKLVDQLVARVREYGIHGQSTGSQAFAELVRMAEKAEAAQ